MSNLILVAVYANTRYTRSLDLLCLLRLHGKDRKNEIPAVCFIIIAQLHLSDIYLCFL